MREREREREREKECIDRVIERTIISDSWRV